MLSRSYDKVPLHENWQDSRIQATAAYLALGSCVEPDPQNAPIAQEWLAQAKDELDLDPDEIYRALVEHERDLVFQTPDYRLLPKR